MYHQNDGQAKYKFEVTEKYAEVAAKYEKSDRHVNIQQQVKYLKT